MGPADTAARDLVRAADERMLREARSVRVTSETVRGRLKRFNGVDAPVLHPPLGARDQYRAEDHGDYVFCPTRLSRAKRPELLVAAMRHTRSRIRLVLAGAPVPRHEALRLRALVLRHGLRGRVTLLPRWIDEAEKVRLYAHARAVAYVPFDEDYGFVPLEAAASERPVVTCTDSGGTHLIVEDGASGRIVPPDPRALAAAFDALMEDDALAQRLGAGARDRLDALGLSWPAVARALLS
jgi:glycosyltransferase involved in cell wall biosynthesis